MTGSMGMLASVGVLAPEIVLAIGACAVLMIGVSRSEVLRAMVVPVSLLVLGVCWLATRWVGVPSVDAQMPGAVVTDLVFYVRMITLLVGALLLLLNWHVPVEHEQGEFASMLLLSMCGVMLTAAADNWLLLFFALELVSVPTYILVGLSREDARASEAAVKYFFLGALSAALMVYGFSFLYGVTGTMQIAGASLTGGVLLNGDLGPIGGATPSAPAYALIGLMLAIAGLAFKIAAVPFHVYAPDVYEGAASPVTAALGFLPKLAGFLAIAKLMAACNWEPPAAVWWMMWALAAATMIAGNVLALLQSNVKRMLAYSSIAHTGYMLVGILVGPVIGSGPMHNGIAALLFYVAVYGVMNLGAFAVISGLRVQGQPLELVSELSGLSRRHKGAALALSICAFSLMGFPLTAGFVGKVYIFSSAFSLSADHALAQPMVILAIIGVLASAVGAVYYLRVSSICYLGEPAVTVPVRAGGASIRVVVFFCGLSMVWWFFRPNDLLRDAGQACHSLTGPGAAVVRVEPQNQATGG